jgi:hypothetical protein
MCKVLGFSNSSKLDVLKASEVIGNIMLQLEPDGYGYAVLGKNGVYGEKYVPQFASTHGTTKTHKAFGKVSQAIGPSIFHGRTSTNHAGLTNCHPIQSNGWHLIHNGVVSDHGPKYKMKTTNDSEHVLHRLKLGIDHVAKDLTGYYAFLAIDDKGQLHVCRDKIARLSFAWIDSLESFIFGTTDRLIQEVCQELKLACGEIKAFDDDVYYVFKGNEAIHSQKINSRGYGHAESQFASLSLGYELDSKLYTPSEYDHDLDAYEYEVGNLDDSYEIFDKNLNQITTDEFYRLDYIDQEQCLIFREDGSSVECNEVAV